MKLPDANILIYAANDTAPQQTAARHWLEDALSGSETVGFAWEALLAFVRVITRPRLLERPASVHQALDVVEEWLARPNATILHPTDRHAEVLRELLAPLGMAGNLTNDAHLAALAIEHGATLYSSDIDFARFRGLRWANPLN